MGKVDQVPFFFIVGRPRSGTTLLRTLFDAHPMVAIPPECKFILDLYPKYGKKTSWSKADLEEFHKELGQQLWFEAWTLDPVKLHSALMACEGANTYSNICKTVYINYRSFFNKEEIACFGDKNPGYTIYTRKLAKIFPGAKFIHIVRDYRDNYVSVKDVDFELPVPSVVARKWKLFYHKFDKDSWHDPSNYTVVRYEDLVTDPPGVMKRLCEFLGLPYRPEVFDFSEKKEEVLKAYPPGFVEKYQANLLNKVNTSRVGIWKNRLTEREVSILDMVAGKTADVAGYERKYRGHNAFLYCLALPGICWANFLALMTKIVDHMPYRLRINILNKWPLKLAGIYQKLFKKRV